MTESVVSLVVDNLVPFLVQETKSLKGVSKEINFVKDELDSIPVFLKDADARADIEDQVKIWVKQVRQVVFCMDDVLDKFRLRIAQPIHGRGCRGWVRKTFGLVKPLKLRHALATQIKEIKAELVDISKRKERYDFIKCSDTLESVQVGGSSSNSIDAWKDEALYVEESELVGIEKHRHKLVSWLVEGEETRVVFSVMATGGVGKTTLVRKAYQSVRVRSNFQCHAWITVSQSLKIEDLLVKLIMQLNESMKDSIPQRVDTMDGTQLIDKLRDYLRHKRYVVILDDMWTIELWNSLKHALLDNQCGSRIMVTTRTHDVVVSFVQSDTHIYHLNPLHEQDTLNLFCKKVFKSYSRGHYPPELEKYSKKIVKRSGGLPLAIVEMAGLLLTKEKTARMEEVP